MAECMENNIILSPDEAMLFQQKLNAPSPVAIERQNKTLDWISQNLNMRETPEGFCITIPDEAFDAKKESSTMDVYKYSVDKGLVYSDSFEKIDVAFVPLNPAFLNVGRTGIKIQVMQETYYRSTKDGYSGTDSTAESNYSNDLGECA